MGKVRIALMDHLRGSKTMVEVPDDVPMHKLLPALVSRLGLPVSQDGRSISYRLDDRQNGKRISNNSTLAEAGIQDNAALVIFAELSSPVLVKILFLAANPTDTTRLMLDEENRAIDLALRQAEFRNQYELIKHGAVKILDIQGYLLRYKPNIVHFSGHGNPNSEIILENALGLSQPVSARSLSQLFGVLKDDIKCVLLNACYSEAQASAIAENIDCVIGMSKAIGDKAAISFATAFYQALGYGRDVKTAFDLGCIQIDMENLSEQDTPQLIAPRVDPQSIFLVHE